MDIYHNCILKGKTQTPYGNGLSRLCELKNSAELNCKIHWRISKKEKTKRKNEREKIRFANEADMARFAAGETEKWRDRGGESERKASENASLTRRRRRTKKMQT